MSEIKGYCLQKDEPNPNKPVDIETKVVQGHSVVFDTDIEAVINSNYNIDIVKYYATLMKIEIRETENKILKERIDKTTKDLQELIDKVNNKTIIGLNEFIPTLEVIQDELAGGKENEYR